MTTGVFNELSMQFWLAAAVFLRIGPAFFLAPGYAERFVSIRVRLALAVSFSLAIAPVLEPYLPETAPSGSDLLKFAARETSIGLFIGLVSRGIIFLLEKTGAIISQSISLSQMLGNATEPMPVISHILTTTGLAILYSTALADQMLYSFVSAYSLSLPPLSELWGYFASKATYLINYIFNQSVTLSSAVLCLIFIYYLFIGFTNKAMPQFMVSFIGIPFVALMSIHFMYQHHELIFKVWQEKSRHIMMLPYGN